MFDTSTTLFVYILHEPPLAKIKNIRRLELNSLTGYAMPLDSPYDIFTETGCSECYKG